MSVYINTFALNVYFEAIDMCRYRCFVAVVAAVVLFLMCFGCFSAAGQVTEDSQEAIFRLNGGISAEDIDAALLEQLEELLSKPLPLNNSSSEKLLESGLFTQYQAAAVADYRKCHGDILSVYELASVDGIGKEYASALSPFISLSPGRGASYQGFKGEIRSRAGVKYSFDGRGRWSAGTRLYVEAGDRFEARLSFSKTLSGRLSPRSAGGNFVWYFRRRPLKLAIGDFNARFGQGLALWNGMGVIGFQSPSSVNRRPSGISPSNSFSADYTFTGIAVQTSSKVFRFSSALALPGIRKLGDGTSDLRFLPMADFSWFTGNGQISVTGYIECSTSLIAANDAGIGVNTKSFARLLAQVLAVSDAKTSISQRWTIGGSVLFSEIAMDWKSFMPAMLAGVSFPVDDNLRLSAMLRYYPEEYSPLYSAAVCSRSKCSNEHSASFTGEFSSGKYVTLSGDTSNVMPSRRHSGSFFADISHIPRPSSKSYDSGLQCKAGVQWQLVPSSFFIFRLKAYERFRSWDKNRFKSELRADFIIRLREWAFSARGHISRCFSYGFLTYLEGGRRDERFSIYLRTGYFCISDRSDRIYVYERDAPGSFNVPAFYGKGLWGAISTSVAFSTWGKLYLRLASVAYPFSTRYKKKPGNAELNIYLKIRF